MMVFRVHGSYGSKKPTIILTTYHLGFRVWAVKRQKGLLLLYLSCPKKLEKRASGDSILEVYSDDHRGLGSRV